ncbi:MAG: hypothetical protein Q9219_004708 [cf. Caloplaca sp. 3 TL-2023]
MAPLPKWKPRRTLIDLYIERDQTEWYWRLVAVVSAALIMIGYLLFPLSFPNNPPQWSAPSATGVVASVLLAIGYVSSAILLFVCKSWVFQLDVVLVPCLFSSLLGFVNVAVALSTHHGEHSVINPSSLAALILCIFSTTTYLTLSLLSSRKIHIVRSRDAMHRNRSESGSYHLLPEDEMQRQQLLRLLQRGNTSNKKAQKPVTSAEASQSTFHIDLPESLRRMETRLTAPRNVYEARTNNDRNNTFDDRGLNFSPLDPRVDFRQIPFPYESLPEDHHQQPPPQQPLPQLPNAIPQTTTEHSSYPERTASHSTQAPPYSPGGVEAPIEKRGEIADLTGEVHPLEREWRRAEEAREQERERRRPRYRVVDAPPVSPQTTIPAKPITAVDDDNAAERGLGFLSPKRKHRGKGSVVGRQRSTSRESRRAEIELERGDGGRRAVVGVELEGVRVSPRIMRVQTDGSWGRR